MTLSEKLSEHLRLAEAANTTDGTGEWYVSQEAEDAGIHAIDAAFIAANDPDTVTALLAVAAAADAKLRCHWGCSSDCYEAGCECVWKPIANALADLERVMSR